MANRFPSFQVYPDDWLGSTARAMMSPAARAAYFDLWCHYWNGSCRGLDPGTKSLRQLAGNPELSDEDVAEIRKHFKLRKGKLHNAKLQAIYKERVAYSKAMEKAGKVGAARRWAGHKEAKQKPIASPMASDASPSPSPIPTPIPEEEEKREVDDVERQLMQKAFAASLPNKPDTIRRYIRAWRLRVGAQEVERVLMLPSAQGLNVMQLEKGYFNGDDKPKRSIQERMQEADIRKQVEDKFK